MPPVAHKYFITTNRKAVFQVGLKILKTEKVEYCRISKVENNGH